MTTAEDRVGALLAGRYLLTAEIGVAGPACSWRAQDTVLGRTVALRVVAAAAESTVAPQVTAVLAAAAASARLADQRFVRTYDAAVLPDGRPFVVREWVPWPTLTAALRDGPLGAEEVRSVGESLADALATAHAAGVVHGHVHPDNVFLGPDGAARLADVAVGAALAGEHPGEREDLAGLGRCLYAGITGHWPGPARFGLPPAPRAAHGPRPPGELRAAVPRALDATVRSLLAATDQPPGVVAGSTAGSAAGSTAGSAAGSAANVARSLRLPRREPVSVPAVPRRVGSPRWGFRAGVAAGLVVVAIGGWLLGLTLAGAPGSAGAPVRIDSHPTSQAAPGSGR